MKGTKRFACTGLVGILTVVIANSASASVFTSIHDATSGQEPDLWQALSSVAPGYAWTSTDYLNSGAGGRRVPDMLDNAWLGSKIDVTLLTDYWGGSANPLDTLGQELVYDGMLLDGATETQFAPRVNTFGATSSLSFSTPTWIVFGDDSNNPTAWTAAPLNAAFSNGERDRVVTFDVSGLDIYGWTANGYQLVVPQAKDGSYIMAFDPGCDQDYQDMLVLVQGVAVPEPATLGLMLVGAFATLRTRKRRR